MRIPLISHYSRSAAAPGSRCEKGRVVPCTILSALCLAFLPGVLHAEEHDLPASIDPDFQSGSGANDDILDLRYYPGEEPVDDRIVIGGYFTQYDGTPRQRVALLDGNGALVEDFVSSATIDNRVDSAVLLDDGKVLIGGFFTEVGPVERNRIARLNADGSLDTTFDPGSGADWLVTDLAVQSDGSIVVVGGFMNFNGQPANHIVRLTPDGAIDPTFDYGTGFNDWPETVIIDSNDRILVGGSFSQYRGSDAGGLVRIASNGEIDQNFAVGAGFNNTVNTLAIDSSERVVVGGDFTEYGGDPVVRLARLDDTDGTLDDTFNTGGGFNNTVHSVAFQSDGRLLVGGQFIEVDGISVRRIARVSEGTGSVDETFDPGAGPDGNVNGVAVQSDGRILLGGEFLEYNADGTNHGRIARLLGGDITHPEGSYASWREEVFGADAGDDEISGPDADPDGDGFANVLEYAFEGDPYVPYSATVPSIATVADNGDDFLEISFFRIAADDLEYRVEASGDISAWQEIWSSVDHPMAEESRIETVTDTEAVGTNPSRFLRVRVNLSE